MITISHSHADGTLLSGSRKGDGVWEILAGLRSAGQGNWRSSRDVGLYLGQSRDKDAQTWKIDKAAEALREAGFEVTVEVDEGEARPFAEREAERVARAEERADRHAGYADNAAARSTAAYEQARYIAHNIPFGQPILVGHHSERRARRDQERMHNGMRRSIDEDKKAGYHAGRAEAAATYQQHREDVPRTLRRIEKLEAEERGVRRALDGRLDYVSDGDSGHKLTLVKPGDGYREQLERRAADLADELAYWRGHVAAREAEGVKVWTRADFAKGDYVLYSGRWYQVERVNPKSLSVPHGNNDHLLAVVTRDKVTHALGPSQWTVKVTYDEVRGRKAAAEMGGVMTFPCCVHCVLGPENVNGVRSPCGDDHGDPCTHEGCPGRDADDEYSLYGDPDGYDRNGAYDGFQVTSDAEGGL
jgi:hypothetical protein